MKSFGTIAYIFITGAFCFSFLFNFFLSLNNMSVVLAVTLALMVYVAFILGGRVFVEIFKSILHQRKIKELLSLVHITIGGEGHVDPDD